MGLTFPRSSILKNLGTIDGDSMRPDSKRLSDIAGLESSYRSISLLSRVTTELSWVIKLEVIRAPTSSVGSGTCFCMCAELISFHDPFYQSKQLCSFPLLIKVWGQSGTNDLQFLRAMFRLLHAVANLQPVADFPGRHARVGGRAYEL